MEGRETSGNKREGKQRVCREAKWGREAKRMESEVKGKNRKVREAEAMQDER